MNIEQTFEQNKWKILFGMGTIIGLFLFSVVNSTHLMDNDPTPFYKPLIDEMTGAYSGVFLIPMLLWLFRRFPLYKSNWFRVLPIYLLASLVYGVTHTTLMLVSRQFIYQIFSLGNYYKHNMFYRFLMEYHKQFISFCIVLAGYKLIIFFQQNQERERKTAELELKTAQLANELSQTQIQSLKAQIQPHFLFNTLNMISSLMYEDVYAADKMISSLSKLLRLTLESANFQKVSLKKELDYVNLYLEIMKARFQEKIVIELIITPESLNALVPNMILQPLVENAIKHNDLSNANRYFVQIKCEKQGERLLLSVSDNGPGIYCDISEVAKKGIGFSNVLKRIKQLYEETAIVSLFNHNLEGLCIRLDLPFETQEREAISVKNSNNR
ncbi:MAG: histidine kinase [Acidobacteria bacterium]|nr:histidine kinase [Acidobacteriota bacterium]